MTHKKHIALIEAEKVNITNLFKLFWAWKYHFVSIVLIFSLMSLAFSYSIPNKYTSIAILKEKRNSNVPGLNAISRLGFGSQVSESKADLAIAVIKSRAFIEKLASDNYIKSSIFAAESYNPSTQEIIYDSSLYSSESGLWNKSEFSDSSGPTFIDVHKVYIKNLRISKDPLTGFVTISYEHVSPKFAYEFLGMIIAYANELVKENDLTEAELAKSFLYDELKNTSSTYVNDAISELIKSHLEIQVKAKSSQNYVFDMIDKPFLPVKRSKPSRFIALIFGLITGILVSIIFVVISNQRLNQR